MSAVSRALAPAASRFTRLSDPQGAASRAAGPPAAGCAAMTVTTLRAVEHGGMGVTIGAYVAVGPEGALRLLPTGRDSTVSDIVRDALDRLTRQTRLQARLGDRSDEEVAEALERARTTRRRRRIPA